MAGDHTTNRPLFTNRAAFVAAALHVVSAAASATPSESPAELPLLDSNALEYVGAFRLPRGGPDDRTFRYGGGAIAWNPDGGTLFVVGHKQHQKTAEISVPELLRDVPIGELNVAEVLQPFADATEGRRREVNPRDPNDQVIGGQFVHGGKLLVNVYSSYDGEGSQSASLFLRGTDLGTAGGVTGPIRVGRDAHVTSAYVAAIPDAWQADFGGPLLIGNCCRSIIGYQSHGPSVSVFDPNGQVKRGALAARTLLQYPAGRQLGPGETSRNAVYNLTTRVDGAVFPDGSRSVLFFGKHGVGPYCYGEAEACGDPAMVYKGTHAYPYVYQVWAYDAVDLLAVRSGKRRPYAVDPYAVWTYKLPYERDGTHDIGGVAFDAPTGRLFVSQLKADSNAMPIIHVFRIVVPESGGAAD